MHETSRASEKRAPSTRRVPLLPPLLLAFGALLALRRSHDQLAVVLLVGALLLPQAVVLAPRFGRALDRAGHRLAHAVGAVLSVVLLGAVHLVVFVPIGVLLGLFRTRLGPPGASAPGWSPRVALAGPPRPASTFDVRAPAPRRSWVTVAAVLVALVVADLGLGAVLGATGVAPGVQGARIRSHRSVIDDMVAGPAMADEPWAEQYSAELIDAVASAASTYEPFLGWQAQDYRSEHINVQDGERSTYQPIVGEGVRPVHLAVFGGSAAFGFGQRDEHTIASQLARLAEDEDLAVRVRNVSATGWVLWQEYLAFERRLAEGERIDLAVFYDGFNELGVQGEAYSPDPSHYDVATLRRIIEDEADRRYEDPTLLGGVGEVASAYAAASGVGRLAHRLRGGDEAVAPVQAELSEHEAQQRERAALDVYARGVQAIRDLGARHGVEVRFFWQAVQGAWLGTFADRLPAGVVDLSGVLEPAGDVWLDGVHHNELGARVVADAIWAEIGSDVGALAADRAAPADDGG